MSASYAAADGEGSTAEARRARRIGEARAAALLPLAPCPLLVDLVLIDRELEPIRGVARASEGGPRQFPVELFAIHGRPCKAD